MIQQKLALDRGNRLRVLPERIQIHATHELDDHVVAVEDISQGKCGLSKRQGRPRERLGGNWLLESFCRGKIHADTQDVREAVFNRDHVQKRQTPSGSELGYDIHIRHLADSRPSRIGAVQKHMLDASGFQLALVFPEYGYDCRLLHATNLLLYSRNLSSPRNIDGIHQDIGPKGEILPRNARL